MSTIHARKLFLYSTLAAVVIGCGGGGGVTPPGSNPVDSTPTPEATAKFSVDVSTGQVAVTPLHTPSRAIFDGSAVRFDSSTLVDQGGDAGRKVIRVSFTNRTGEPIGRSPDGAATGVSVMFSPFVNVGAFSDLRPKTQVETAAGNGTSGKVDGIAASASFNAPYGVCLSGDGGLMVTDNGGNYVRKLRNGVVSTVAGTGVAGNTDGAGTSAKLNGPAGIARNPVDGAFFICDNLGNRIRRMTDTGVVATIAGTGVAGGANGLGNVATFTGPRGITVDNQGAIYVTEDGHRVRRIVFNGGNASSSANYTVSTRAGTGAPGAVNAVGTAASFNFPAGIVSDGGDALYVADLGNNLIRRISSGGEVTTVAGDGSGGGLDGMGTVARFSQPHGIGFANGGLVVSEKAGNRLRQITLVEGATPNAAKNWRVATLAGASTAGFVNGSGTDARFDTPGLLAMDAGNDVFLADTANNRLRRMIPANGNFPIGTPSGAVPTELVTLANATGYLGKSERPYIAYPGDYDPGESSAAIDWVFSIPEGVTAFEFSVSVEADTEYYAGLHGVSNPGPTGVGSPQNMVRTIAGRDIGGHVDGAATVAKFNSVNGLAMSDDGVLFAADSANNSIRRIEPSGLTSTVAGVAGIGAGATDGAGNTAQFNNPGGVAVTPDGKTVYVADSSNHRIRIVRQTGSDPRDPASWTVNTIAGSTQGYADNTTGNLAQYDNPFGIALGQGGELYVAELGGNRVRRLQSNGSPVWLSTNWRSSLVAGSTSGTSGTTDSNGSSARFFAPRQIAVDKVGNLYIADSSNCRVRKIDPDGDVKTLAGGAYGYADATGTSAMFGTIYSIAIDAAGYVFVGEDTQRIRRVSPTGVVTTVAGTGTYGDLDGPGNVSLWYYPTGMVCDRSGALYVATGGQYPFEGGGSSTSPGLRIKLVQRIVSSGVP